MPNKQNLSNKQKAIALLQTFTTGKTDLVADFVREDYIQHNIEFSTGREAILSAMKSMSQQNPKPRVNVIRAIEDGHFVVLHVAYNWGGHDLVSFDVFRFDKNNQIAEHWDNLIPLQKPNPSGRTQIDGPTEITNLDKTNDNKKLVREFQEALIKGDMAAAAHRIDPQHYKQHNPQVGDGLEAVTAAFAAAAKAGMQMKFNIMHHLIGEGNFVFVSTEGTIGKQPVAIFDLFRVEKNKIVEHWDVIAPIKDKKDIKGVNNPYHKF